MELTELIEKFNEDLENEIPGYIVNQISLMEIEKGDVNPKTVNVTPLCWKYDPNLKKYVPC